MSNDLVVVSSNTLSSDTGSVTLTGMSSSFTHYLATFNEVTPTVANADLQFRFTVGGSAVSSNDYDEAIAFLRSDSTNDNDSQTNRNNMFLTGSIENDDEGEESASEVASEMPAAWTVKYQMDGAASIFAELWPDSLSRAEMATDLGWEPVLVPTMEAAVDRIIAAHQKRASASLL